MVYALRMSFARAARENLRHFNGEEPGVQTNYLCTKQKQSGGLVLLKALIQLHSLERPRTLLYYSCTSIRLDLLSFPSERVVSDRERNILIVLMIMLFRLKCVSLLFLTQKVSSQISSEYSIYYLNLFCLLIQSYLASDLFLISADRRFLSSGHNS